MRKVKFEAYIKNLKWSVPVKIINFDCKTVEVDLSDGNGDYSEYDFDEIELMQYTGLKDKDNIEIYEGDIVKCLELRKNTIEEYISEVFFEDGCWLVHESETCDTDLYLYDNTNPTKMPLTEIEVIGNIYENPELVQL